MKYLHIREDGRCTQTNEEPSAEQLEEIDQGTLDIYRFEPERGFCRLLVDSEEDEDSGETEYSIDDWERVDLS